MFHSKIDNARSQPVERCRSAIDSIRHAPPPALAGDFARAAYFGALSISDLLAVIAQPDPYLMVMTDMFIHGLHEVPYTFGDARQITGLEDHDAALVVSRLMRRNMLRRVGKFQGNIPFQDYDRIELGPMQRAELAGFFARAYERGPAALDELMRGL